MEAGRDIGVCDWFGDKAEGLVTQSTPSSWLPAPGVLSYHLAWFSSTSFSLSAMSFIVYLLMFCPPDLAPSLSCPRIAEEPALSLSALPQPWHSGGHAVPPYPRLHFPRFPLPTVQYSLKILNEHVWR